MFKFKQTLKMIEEGLLKPMDDFDIDQITQEIDIEELQKRINDILSRSTKNADGSIDVEGNVDFHRLKLKKLPLRFNKVSGIFECDSNQLTNLDGAPKEVSSGFYCHYNQLTSLEGGPSKVDGSFVCFYNNLTDLKGFPKEVGGDVNCAQNKVEFTGEQVRVICKVKGYLHV